MEGREEGRAVKAEDVLQMLEKAGPSGLSLAEMTARMSAAGRPVSERTVRRVLDDLLKEGSVVATVRKSRAGPGRPERVYILRRFFPKQPSIFEAAPGVKKAEVRTLDELPFPESQEDVGLLDEERRRRESAEAVSLFERIATGLVEEDRLARAVIEAAPLLAEEDPVDLLVSMLRGLLEDVDGLAEKFLRVRGRAYDEADRSMRLLEDRISAIRRYFVDLWGLDVDLPSLPELRREGRWQRPGFDEAEVRRRLETRIRGKRVLAVLDLGDVGCRLQAGAGTDGSVADIELEPREGSFLLPARVSVFTAAAALEVSSPTRGAFYTDYDLFPEHIRYYDDEKAAEAGYLLAPGLQRLFGEEDLRHARYAALSLRQYEEDLRVLRGEARWRPLGDRPALGLPPRTELVVRDGRIFPTVHRLRDFEEDGLYGRLVRNEIRRFYEVVDLVRPDGPCGHVAYTGVVKEPEFSWLSPAVFWFLYEKGDLDDIERVYRAPFPDPVLAHLLFLGLARSRPDVTAERGRAFCTFGMIRRFSDIVLDRNERPPKVNGRRIDEDDPHEWWEYVRERTERARAEGRHLPIDVEDYRPFVYLCARTGVLMAYGAPCTFYRPLTEGGGGHFLIPRLEAAARTDDPGHADGALKRLLAWLCAGHGELDLGHARPLPSGDTLAPLVPRAVVEADKVAKFAKDEMKFRVKDEIYRLVSMLRSRYSNRR